MQAEKRRFMEHFVSFQLTFRHVVFPHHPPQCILGGRTLVPSFHTAEEKPNPWGSLGGVRLEKGTGTSLDQKHDIIAFLRNMRPLRFKI